MVQYSISANLNKYIYKMIKQKQNKRFTFNNIDRNINKPKTAVIFFDQPIKSRQMSKHLRQHTNNENIFPIKRSSLGLRSSSLFNVSIIQKTKYKAIKSIKGINKNLQILGQSRMFQLNDLINVDEKEDACKYSRVNRKIRIRLVTQNYMEREIIIPKQFPKVSVKGIKII